MPTPSSAAAIPTWSRRQMLQTLGCSVGTGAFAASVCPPLLANQDEPPPLNRFPRMVHEYFVEQVHRSQQRKMRRMESLESRADAEEYVEEVRRKIRVCFGPEPSRTPLNARVTGIVERENYRIEKVIFESRPRFPVTANLYLPRHADQPAPGVVGTCGHSSNGKAAEAYQGFAQGLARKGYVCLLYDPISQGERLQYLDENLNSRIRPGVGEHLYAGNQQFLVGDFLGSWRAWDGIRALDYLLTRKEVDPNHLGVTGNSGGGTMTTWLCGVEPRWTMAAPSCFVTSFRRNLENELPADTEQCPPRALALGLDHDDFLAAMAPRPVIILAKERDYFDVRGSQEAYERLRRLYGLLGAEENIGLFVGPTTHGYSQENREAMYGWFNRVTGISDEQAEGELEIESDETLWCTANGQIHSEPRTRTVFDFTRAKARRQKERRGSPSGEALVQAVQSVLRLPRMSEQPPSYRILRYPNARDYPRSHAIAYAVASEPDVFGLVYMLTDERWYSRPPEGGPHAILYVADKSSDEELRNEPLTRDLLEANSNASFFACDVRGIGESRPDTCGINSFYQPYGCDYFYAIHALMLNRPYLGQKTFDVLRILQWLEAHGYREVHVAARGWGTLPATLAAVLSPRVTQVTLKHPLTAYQDIAESEEYDWPLSTFLPGVLNRFDLPDCYDALAGKSLQMIEPRGASS